MGTPCTRNFLVSVSFFLVVDEPLEGFMYRFYAVTQCMELFMTRPLFKRHTEIIST